jgi:hypothetical protein
MCVVVKTSLGLNILVPIATIKAPSWQPDFSQRGRDLPADMLNHYICADWNIEFEYYCHTGSRCGSASSYGRQQSVEPRDKSFWPPTELVA